MKQAEIKVPWIRFRVQRIDRNIRVKMHIDLPAILNFLSFFFFCAVAQGWLFPVDRLQAHLWMSTSMWFIVKINNANRIIPFGGIFLRPVWFQLLPFGRNFRDFSCRKYWYCYGSVICKVLISIVVCLEYNLLPLYRVQSTPSKAL